MMEQNLDEMLKEIYREKEPLPQEWNDRLRARLGEKKRIPWYRHGAAAVVLLVCLMGVPCSVYAYFHYMTPAQTAKEMGQDKLAEKFSRQQDEVQTVTSKGYRISYLGVVTGKNLEEGLEGAEVEKEKTYIVTAIQKENGEAMTYGDEFFVSPLIGGLEPIHYNLSMMEGSAVRMIQDGIQYSITACDSVGIFADRTLYLAVQDGSFLSGEAYSMDDQTGEITADADYPEVNVLFPIQLDKNMADREKADACIAEVEKGLEDSSESEVDEAETEEDDKAAAQADWNDYVKKFPEFTVTIQAAKWYGFRTGIGGFGYDGDDKTGEVVTQDVYFFPVVQGKGIKKVSFDIDGGEFYQVDSLSEEEAERLKELPADDTYRRVRSHWDAEVGACTYGIRPQPMGTVSIQAEGDRAEALYAIQVRSAVRNTSKKQMRKNQQKVMQQLEKVKIKMKVEKEDGSVIEKTIICRTRKYELKELSHDNYSYAYDVE